MALVLMCFSLDIGAGFGPDISAAAVIEFTPGLGRGPRSRSFVPAVPSISTLPVLF
jgi:hypothetical protein